MGAIKPRLDVNAVKTRAASVPGCEMVSTTPSGGPLCSFITGMSSGKAEDLCRVHVFTDTGTVSVGRIVQGKYRQVFRRNVSSLDVVEDLLRSPPPLTKIDESLLSSTAAPKSVIGQLEMVEIACAILEGERERLANHLESLPSLSSAMQAAATPAPSAGAIGGTSVDPSSPGEESFTTVGLSGLEFQFSLPPESMKDVDQCLTDIHSMGKLVRKVATNGRGSVFLYGNGGVAYTPNVPKSLYHRLSQLRHSSYESRPAYVSLGSRDRYFCSFHDGSHAFKGPKGLDRELRKLKKPPSSVAFGSTYDTFCLVFKDGSWKCGGRGVPGDLMERLGARKDVQTVTLGPEGEWFLKLRGGTMWWGGIHSELDAAIQDLLENNHYIHFLDFGEGGSYFVSYD